ncbi:MAG: MMPL family transporter, partial [Sneathiella sp.]
SLATMNGSSLIQRSLATLYMPGSLRNSKFLQQDPLGLYSQFLTGISSSLGSSRIYSSDNQIYRQLAVSLTEDRDTDRDQSAIIRDIDTVVSIVESTLQDLDILYIGVPAYAEKIAKVSRQETLKVTVIALAGIALFLLIVFRSFLPIAGALLTIFIGVSSGVVATLLIFGTVHLIAVAFGASLVGVVVDYAIHFYTTRRRSEPTWQTARRIRPGLIMGAGTSVSGFLVLAFADIDLLQQIAVYSAFGAAGAAAGVLFLMPSLKVLTSGGDFRTPSQRWWKLHNTAGHSFLLPVLSVSSVLLGGALLLDGPTSSDQVQLLRVQTPELAQTEKKIADIGGAFISYLLLVQGEETEEILQREEVLRALFKNSIADGSIDHIWGVSTILPSVKQQNRVSDLGTALLKMPLADPLMSIIPKAEVSPQPLSLDEKGWAMLPSEVQKLRVQNKQTNEQGHFMIIRGASDASSLQERIGDLNWVSLIDTTARYSSGFANMRRKATFALLGGIIAINFLFMFRFGWMKGLRVMSVPTFSTVASLVLVALLGTGLTFFTIMAGFLVFALGADYSLFQMAAKTDDKSRTYLAVGLSALSTVLVFGLMAFSLIPVLQIMGSVVVIGVVLSWALAPLVVRYPNGIFNDTDT